MWADNYNVTYDYSALSSMISGSKEDANSYWKVPASAGNSATIAIPIANQPTSDITITFSIATFGSGNNPSSSNTTITAVGTESNSNWSGSGVSSYPSSKNFVDGTMTITKPDNPTTLAGLNITMGVNTGVKIFRLQSITVSYTYGNTPSTYTVTYDANGGTGTMTDSNSPYAANATVTLLNNTFTAPSGKVWDSWSVKDASNNTIAVTNNQFTMPASNVTVTAQWEDEQGGGNGETLTFDFEDNSAHRTEGSNSYTSTNTYSENGVDISLTYADAVTSGSPLSGSANVMGRIAKNTTNSPVILIGPIDISNWTISKIEYKTKGVAAMAQVFETSLNGSSWTTQKSLDSMPTTNTTETVNNLSITGDELYLRWTVSVSSSTGSARDFQLDDVVITYTSSSTPTPSITISNNNEIAYDATSGSFDFTVNNPVTGGVTSVSENVDWISNAAVSNNSVTFTTTANEANTSRSGVITLTYTYNTSETVTKDVTVTQAAAPVIYTTIPALFAAATSTATDVNVTFGGWVVSAVHNNNAYLTDNQGNGLIIYAASHGFQVNDVLTGTVSCKLQLYRGSAELIELTSSTTGLTVTSNGTVSEQNIAISNLSGVNTGALLTYEGLTFDGTHLVDANSNTITPYNTLYDYNAFESGKTYNVTGIYLQYNTTKELLPRSADDIEEVVVTTPSITVSPAMATPAASDIEGTLAISYQNLDISDMTDFDVQFCDSEGNELAAGNEPTWIEVLVAEDNNEYVVSYTMDTNEGAARTAYFKIYALDNNADEVYSNLVTVTQAAPVVDYATLPFEFNGGRADIETENGLTQEGLDTDYSSAPKLKFNTTNDCVILKLNEAPGMVSFTTVGNSFSGGTFKLQTSADGSTYTDKKVYRNNNDLGGYDSFILDSDVRYIKWIYTEKSSGNVGLGNIQVSKRENVNVTAAGYATFCSTSKLNFTERDDVYAYTATVSDNAITFKRIQVVPANTGVLLYSVSGEAVSASIPVFLGTPSEPENNLFVAATTEIPNLASASDGKDNYILYNGNYGIGFYLANGKKVGAGKAYLAVPQSAAEVRSFVALPGGINTGIQTSNNLTIGQSDNCYDLQGRRVSTPKNGLYIINGKKVLLH